MRVEYEKTIESVLWKTVGRKFLNKKRQQPRGNGIVLCFALVKKKIRLKL